MQNQQNQNQQNQNQQNQNQQNQNQQNQQNPKYEYYEEDEECPGCASGADHDGAHINIDGEYYTGCNIFKINDLLILKHYQETNY